MPAKFRQFYDFEQFRLDLDTHRLFRKGEVISLPPKAVELLIIFLQNSGTLLERNQLMQAGWAKNLVEDANCDFTLAEGARRTR